MSEPCEPGTLGYTWLGAPKPSTPVLLLRPLGGTMALWGPFAERLARDFAVLAFDHGGTGASRAAPVRTSARALAQDALGLLDRLGVARAHVFGISLGAMAAVWLARLAPDRVASLCLASAPVRGRALLGRDVAAALRLSACFARRPSRVEPCLVQHVLSPRFLATNPAEALRILTLVAGQPTHPLTLLKNTGAAVRFDATSILPALQMRTLVLAGDNDGLLGPQVVKKVADLIPGARFEVIPGAGHDLTLEQPQATADRVAAFFKSCARD